MNKYHFCGFTSHYMHAGLSIENSQLMRIGTGPVATPVKAGPYFFFDAATHLLMIHIACRRRRGDISPAYIETAALLFFAPLPVQFPLYSYLFLLCLIARRCRAKARASALLPIRGHLPLIRGRPEAAMPFIYRITLDKAACYILIILRLDAVCHAYSR